MGCGERCRRRATYIAFNRRDKRQRMFADFTGIFVKATGVLYRDDLPRRGKETRQ
jgi:hypothetical protein